MHRRLLTQAATGRLLLAHSQGVGPAWAAEMMMSGGPLLPSAARHVRATSCLSSTPSVVAAAGPAPRRSRRDDSRRTSIRRPSPRRGASSSAPAPEQQRAAERPAAPGSDTREDVAALLAGMASVRRGKPPPPSQLPGVIKDKPIGLPRGVVEVLQTLRDAGEGGAHDAYLVGGAVRDTLLGGRPKDFDILTTAPPSAMARLFARARLVGARFPVTHVHLGAGLHEVSTLLPVGQSGAVRPPPRRGAREGSRDGGGGAAAAAATGGGSPRKRAVAAATAALNSGTWPADPAARAAALEAALAASATVRDFTVNALFLDPWTGAVHDPTGRGVADLAARRLVSVDADPAVSFRTDPARMLRAVRLASRTGLRLADADVEALRDGAPALASLNAGRLATEVTALIAHGSAFRAVSLARAWGVLPYLLPTLADLLERECGPAGQRGDRESADEEETGSEGGGEAAAAAAATTTKRRKPSRVGGMSAIAALDSCANPVRPAPPGVVAAALAMPLLADEIRRWRPGAEPLVDEEEEDEGGEGGRGDDGDEADSDEPASSSSRRRRPLSDILFARLVRRAVDALGVPGRGSKDPTRRVISKSAAVAASRLIKKAAAGGEAGGDGSALVKYEPVFRECVPMAVRVRALAAEAEARR